MTIQKVSRRMEYHGCGSPVVRLVLENPVRSGEEFAISLNRRQWVGGRYGLVWRVFSALTDMPAEVFIESPNGGKYLYQRNELLGEVKKLPLFRWQ